jgi:hypothetical protein
VSFTPIQKMPSDKAIGFILSPYFKKKYDLILSHISQGTYKYTKKYISLMAAAQEIADHDRDQPGCQGF